MRTTIRETECVHPFWDGNGRIGRLLTLLLLYQAGYEVGRYISLERLIEESKETYYEVLLKSSHDWHEAKHDLRPWWNYFLGTLVTGYKEFEERVGTDHHGQGREEENGAAGDRTTSRPVHGEGITMGLPGCEPGHGARRRAGAPERIPPHLR